MEGEGADAAVLLVDKGEFASRVAFYVGCDVEEERDGACGGNFVDAGEGADVDVGGLGTGYYGDYAGGLAGVVWELREGTSVDG